MKLLVDVNIEDATIQWLHSRGHDLLLAREHYRQAPDTDLLEIAVATHRVVLTRDKDFGDLVFRDHRASAGVILLRIHAANQSERLAVVQSFWPEVEASVAGSLVVINNDRLRIRPLPHP